MRLNLSLLLITLYAGQGAWIPYVGLWLTEQGISAVSLSLLFSVMLLSKVVSSPIVAHLCDTSGRPERVGTVLSLGLAACYAPLLVPGLPAPVIVALVILASAIAPTLFPIADRLILRISGPGGSNFGRHRLWGSVGFASGTLIAGQIATLGGLDWVIASVACLTVAAFLALVALQWHSLPTPAINDKRGQAPWRVLLGCCAIWPPLIAAALIFASNAHLYTLAPLEWSDAQMTLRSISLIWAAGIAAEVLGFLIGAPILRKFAPSPLLLIAALLSAVRWLIMALWPDPAILLLAQLGQVATVALTSIAFAAAVSRHVPQDAQVSAFAMFTLLAMGPFISLATLASSLVTVSFAVSGFVAMIPVCLLAAGITGIDLAKGGGNSDHQNVRN